MQRDTHSMNVSLVRIAKIRKLNAFDSGCNAISFRDSEAEMFCVTSQTVESYSSGLTCIIFSCIAAC